MQFPESWLRTLCNPSLSTAELAERLTMAGLEVEELQPVAPPLLLTKVVSRHVWALAAALQSAAAERERSRCFIVGSRKGQGKGVPGD